MAGSPDRGDRPGAPLQLRAARWHGFSYADDQYFVDLCKLLLTTPALTLKVEYSEFGIPATFWRIICVKTASCREVRSQLDSVPADAGGERRKIQLVAMLGQFEQHIEADTPLTDVADHL